MTVWVAVAGCYSDMNVIGVYATAEAGIDDNPIPADYKYPEKPHGSNVSRRGGWMLTDGYWDNGLDWDAGISLMPFELKGAVVIPMARQQIALHALVESWRTVPGHYNEAEECANELEAVLSGGVS